MLGLVNQQSPLRALKASKPWNLKGSRSPQPVGTMFPFSSRVKARALAFIFCPPMKYCVMPGFVHATPVLIEAGEPFTTAAP